MAQTVTVTSTILRPASVGTATSTQQSFNPFLLSVMETDLQNVFFNGGDFNEQARIYHTVLGAWQPYSVDFDDPSTTVDFGADADLSDLKPQFMIPNYALKAKLSKQDKVVIRGTQYIIEDINNDGVGVTTVFMRRR